MKYSDQQRIDKIYENAVKLHEYIREHKISKEEMERIGTSLQTLYLMSCQF